jgi:hypothetical protein
MKPRSSEIEDALRDCIDDIRMAGMRKRPVTKIHASADVVDYLKYLAAYHIENGSVRPEMPEGAVCMFFGIPVEYRSDLPNATIGVEVAR